MTPTPPPPKGPPRFVPTLTEVVRLDQPAVPEAVRSAPVPAPTPTPTPASARPTGAESPAALAEDRLAPSVEDRVQRSPSFAAPVTPASTWAASPLPAPAPARAMAPMPVETPARPAQAAAPATALPAGIEEYIVHRVMQRVDVVLDQRLREAIATVVQEQTRSMVPRLREEVESVVRHAVYEAVAEELSADGSTPH
ncbi:hypothetical protein [Acidovorax sp. Leaf160]|uniref:hypothetical protein n=1 Tax=Acidovorax sp. Leaf160 TaxID=1736280 RepID=UPI0009E9B22B|nr:hypothetical protein [Acidovorax sp. Leaf160]